ncbi:hypothetical protein BpHYR1_001638 [Brachionus plicatilis]|uniref:Uncharacterized protein n=1 Tax=Brachionus plicatilis TaxID=10195 RepID=A0A3M7PT70_BRAPC|nr:hypothetical protein BpHYR1_001638 [Brachionus plicatilis]
MNSYFESKCFSAVLFNRTKLNLVITAPNLGSSSLEKIISVQLTSDFAFLNVLEKLRRYGGNASFAIQSNIIKS